MVSTLIAFEEVMDFVDGASHRNHLIDLPEGNCSTHGIRGVRSAIAVGEAQESVGSDGRPKTVANYYYSGA
jgi:hypothetical protein